VFRTDTWERSPVPGGHWFRVRARTAGIRRWAMGSAVIRLVTIPPSGADLPAPVPFLSIPALPAQVSRPTGQGLSRSLIWVHTEYRDLRALRARLGTPLSWTEAVPKVRARLRRARDELTAIGRRIWHRSGTNRGLRAPLEGRKKRNRPAPGGPALEVSRVQNLVLRLARPAGNRTNSRRQGPGPPPTPAKSSGPFLFFLSPRSRHRQMRVSQPHSMLRPDPAKKDLPVTFIPSPLISAPSAVNTSQGRPIKHRFAVEALRSRDLLSGERRTYHLPPVVDAPAPALQGTAPGLLEPIHYGNMRPGGGLMTPPEPASGASAP